jgi:hypothetical protein
MSSRTRSTWGRGRWCIVSRRTGHPASNLSTRRRIACASAAILVLDQDPTVTSGLPSSAGVQPDGTRTAEAEVRTSTVLSCAPPADHRWPSLRPTGPSAVWSTSPGQDPVRKTDGRPGLRPDPEPGSGRHQVDLDPALGASVTASARCRGGCRAGPMSRGSTNGHARGLGDVEPTPRSAAWALLPSSSAATPALDRADHGRSLLRGLELGGRELQRLLRAADLDQETTAAGWPPRGSAAQGLGRLRTVSSRRPPGCRCDDASPPAAWPCQVAATPFYHEHPVVDEVDLAGPRVGRQH